MWVGCVVDVDGREGMEGRNEEERVETCVRLVTTAWLFGRSSLLGWKRVVEEKT